MHEHHHQLDGEHETSTGWLYTFTLFGGHEPTHHELTLSWVDHEHLVNGAIAPERVASAVFGLATETLGDKMPSKSDVSILRRLVAGFDEQVRSRISAPL